MGLPVTLQELLELGGEDFVRKLLEVFETEASARVLELRAALRRNDLPAVGRAAHRLRGASGSVGAVEVMQLSAQVEALSATAEADSLLPLIEALEQAVRLAVSRAPAPEEAAPSVAPTVAAPSESTPPE